MSWCANSTCLQPSTGTAGATFQAALQFFAAQQCLIPETWPGYNNIKGGASFDFIVVGAGSAGATLAARLAEVPQWKVLLVEAGDTPPVESTIPGLFSSLLRTKYDWNYTTVDEIQLENGIETVTWPYYRGKALGGSSSTNYMMYVRGSPADFDAWAAYDNEGWNWNDVLPYLKKSENMTDEMIKSNENSTDLHGYSGPIRVSRPDIFGTLNNKLLDSFEEIGIPKLLDLNGPQLLGVSTPHLTAFEGVRQSTAEVFLKTTKSNLYILKNTLATKIIFDKKRAIGVTLMLENGQLTDVYASSEIISSAGVFGSAQLLLLSGIGPQDELNELGIPVIANLPVGKNLSDHFYVSIYLTGPNNTTDEAGTFNQQLQYLIDKTGPLSAMPVPLITGLFESKENQQNNRPNFQVFQSYSPASSSRLESACRYNLIFPNETCASLVAANKDHECYETTVTLVHPKSRGKLSLQSKDPTVYPIIELGIFSDENDLELLAEGIERLSSVVDTSYFRSINSSIVQLNLENCNNLTFKSREYWRCYALNLSRSWSHAAGTCSMGPDGVVDADGTVQGVVGLRVADLSIAPTTIGGNTNAASIMIGEKIADMIKEEHTVNKKKRSSGK